MRYFLIALLLNFLASPKLYAQSAIPEEEDPRPKIKHADPVFEDLTTELGARRGENELNINFGYRKLRENHHVFLSQLEYEIAPINNLGIEVLLPYTMYFNNQLDERDRPGNRMEFLQWGTQYTFHTSAKRKISMALAFRNILETQDPNQTDRNFSLATVSYNPFLIFANNWQDKYFFLASGGFQVHQEVVERQWGLEFPLNTAFHYNFSERDHFVGVEFNKIFEEGEFEMFIRPQVIFQVFEDYIVGISFGIPVNMPDVKWTTFLRLAYEFR
ncbi:hypothetical protein BH23BAC1_BH23BAC1_48230 [soil metagenome]